MMERSIEFVFKARFFIHGELNKDTKQIWFVLHGYGQLARFFIKKFESLQKHGVCVIAPEGLSHFYSENIETRAATGNNRVGATWMTAENRLMDIDNYLNYLDTVYQKMLHQFRSIPVTVLGFSQGAATASRWAVHTQYRYERLILWSGIFPPDMDFNKASEILSGKEVVLAYGTKDPYINNSRLTEMSTLINKLSLKPRVLAFEGGHDIDEKTLLSFL